MNWKNKNQTSWFRNCAEIAMKELWKAAKIGGVRPNGVKIFQRNGRFLHKFFLSRSKAKEKMMNFFSRSYKLIHRPAFLGKRSPPPKKKGTGGSKIPERPVKWLRTQNVRCGPIKLIWSLQKRRSIPKNPQDPKESLDLSEGSQGRGIYPRTLKNPWDFGPDWGSLKRWGWFIHLPKAFENPNKKYTKESQKEGTGIKNPWT